MLPVAIAGDGFGIAPSRWYFPDKVRTTLQNVTVKRISATFEAGVDGGPGAFRRPSAAGLGEPGAVREGFCTAAFFAEGDWANREDQVAIAYASQGGGRGGGVALGDELAGGFNLVAADFVFAGGTLDAVLANDFGPDRQGGTFGIPARW